jgi:hypothetical protein
MFFTSDYSYDKACISAISENALEIISTDCGDFGRKDKEWNNMVISGAFY